MLAAEKEKGRIIKKKDPPRIGEGTLDLIRNAKKNIERTNNMRKIICLFMLFAILLGLCGCGNSNNNQQQATPTQKPVKYEDTLIEKVKIGDSLTRANEIFGKVKSSEQIAIYVFYEYEPVVIFGEQYTPKVIVKDGRVYSYGYHLISSSTSVKKVAYQNLTNHFTSLYGEPFESKDGVTKWYFADGGYLQLTEDTHDKNIFYCKE